MFWGSVEAIILKTTLEQTANTVKSMTAMATGSSKRRFQIFISSTYTDLKAVRAKVLRAIMQLDCIPASMEFFNAVDEEQFNFIKTVIDDSDYYVVIVAGRYGSMTSEGISFTEKEYEYAKAKGLRVLAFIHSSPDSIAVDKAEIDPVIRARLDAFREKLSAARVVKFWDTEDGLVADIVLSLTQAFRVHPAVGWIRGNAVTDETLLSQLNSVRNENDELKAQLSAHEKNPDRIQPLPDNLASGTDQIELKGYYWEHGAKRNWTGKYSVDDIFSMIGPDVASSIPESDAIENFAKKISLLHSQLQPYDSHFRLDRQRTQSVGFHLHALGLIKVETGDAGVSWEVTRSGFDYLMQLLAFHKTGQEV